MKINLNKFKSKSSRIETSVVKEEKDNSEKIEQPIQFPEPDLEKIKEKPDNILEPLTYQREPSIIHFLFYSGPIAWILTKKNFIQKRQIRFLAKRFFITDLGIYEFDPDYDYKYKRQSTTLYISHGKTMDKKLVKKFYKLWRKKQDDKMLVELKKYEPEIAKNKYTTIEKAFEDITKLHYHSSIDIDTEKYLYSHRAYNPKALRMSRLFVHQGMKGVQSIYPKLKVPLPWVVVMALLIGLAIVAQHLTEWIGALISGLMHLVGAH